MIIRQVSSKVGDCLTRANAVRLYRELLQKSRGLNYTSKDFYIRQIQAEFRKYQHEEDMEICRRQYDKGVHFLKTNLGGLI